MSEPKRDHRHASHLREDDTVARDGTERSGSTHVQAKGSPTHLSKIRARF